MLKTEQKEAGVAIFSYFPSIPFGFLGTCSQQNILDSRWVLGPHLQMGDGNIDPVKEKSSDRIGLRCQKFAVRKHFPACMFFGLFSDSISSPHWQTTERNSDMSDFAKTKQSAVFPKFLSLI